MLQYQVKVGTGSNTNNIVSGVQASPNYVNRLMPNGQSRTMLLKNLICGLTYYWNAATVDTGFKTTWGSEKSFSISSDCSTITEGVAAAAPEVGGGWSWNTLRQEPKAEEIADGTITVAAFLDSNGSGKREFGEKAGFEGLPVRVGGTGIDGSSVDQSGIIGVDGTVRIRLKASDLDGYTVSVDTGSSVMDGFKATRRSMSGVVLGPGQNLNLDFGFKRRALLGYLPCLSVGAKDEEEQTGDSDSLELLSRLRDGYGNKVTDGLDLGSQLVRRRTFFSLLRKTQCLDVKGNSEEVRSAVQGKGVKEFRDLPISGAADSILAYSLVLDGLPVGRMSGGQENADMGLPISRRETVELIGAAVKSGTETGSGATAVATASGGEEVLPPDMKIDDPDKETYLRLKQLKLLPRSFDLSFSPESGLTVNEAVELMLRAAMVNGKIGLTATESDEETEVTEGPPTFLSTLSGFKVPECLTKQPKRAEEFKYSDIAPGDPLYADLRMLLTYGVKNSQGRTLWLIPGTGTVSEFGVERGQGELKGSEPASVLETMRALLVLTCRPPSTALDVTKTLLIGEQQREAGTGERRIPKDRVSDLKRTADFDSRVMYRSQDHEREYDLALFSYAPGLLRKDPRPVEGALTVEEAAEILSSALTGMAVKQGIVGPVDAEGKAGQLAEAIKIQLLGQSTVERDTEGLAMSQIFTREMLVKFLGTVVSVRMNQTTVTRTELPLGELWWERIR
jgi:hypothetical protein